VKVPANVAVPMCRYCEGELTPGNEPYCSRACRKRGMDQDRMMKRRRLMGVKPLQVVSETVVARHPLPDGAAPVKLPIACADKRRPCAHQAQCAGWAMAMNWSGFGCVGCPAFERVPEKSLQRSRCVLADAVMWA
jgi:hypothetical protein